MLSKFCFNNRVRFLLLKEDDFSCLVVVKKKTKWPRDCVVKLASTEGGGGGGVRLGTLTGTFQKCTFL